MLSTDQALQFQQAAHQAHQASGEEYLTVVIRLPVNAQRRAIIEANLGVGEQFHGGTITGVIKEDALTLCELLEEICDSAQLEEARLRAQMLRCAPDIEGQSISNSSVVTMNP